LSTVKVRGIRGATTCVEDASNDIFSATQELMLEVIERNHLAVDDVASVFLTMTQDLHADFPAKAVRGIDGWQWVPLMCAPELIITGALAKCVRVLVHVNTSRPQQDMVHVYLRDAIVLRPDLSGHSL